MQEICIPVKIHYEIKDENLTIFFMGKQNTGRIGGFKVETLAHILLLELMAGFSSVPGPSIEAAVDTGSHDLE